MESAIGYASRGVRALVLRHGRYDEPGAQHSPGCWRAHTQLTVTVRVAARSHYHLLPRLLRTRRRLRSLPLCRRRASCCSPCRQATSRRRWSIPHQVRARLLPPSPTSATSSLDSGTASSAVHLSSLPRASARGHRARQGAAEDVEAAEDVRYETLTLNAARAATPLSQRLPAPLAPWARALPRLQRARGRAPPLAPGDAG